MADFAIRSGSIDVEEIMRHIRKRIRDKRGVDYTEQEIRELANVKLQRILDPTGVRSDLLKHFRDRPKPTWPEHYSFENHTIYASTSRLVVFFRRLLRPVLKLLFSPNPLIDTLHKQSLINSHIEARFGEKDEHDALNNEILNNLVVEVTRLSIEVNNLKMQVQSVNSRLDFDERRARALEGLVNPPAAGTPTERKAKSDAEESGDGASKPRRRRRRRRGGRRRTPQDGEVNQTVEAETKIVETENQEEPSPIAETAVGAGSDKSAESSTEEPEPPEAATPRPPDDGAADTPEK